MLPSTRVLCSLPDGAQSSLFLGTRLFDLLTDDVGVEWTFSSPMASDHGFARRFEKPGVRLIDWPTRRWSRFDYSMQVLRQELRKLRTGNATTKIFTQRLAWVSPRRRLWVNRLAGWIDRFPAIDRGLDSIENRLLADGEWDEILRETTFDAVVLGSGAIKLEEVPLARAAKRRGIPIFGIVPSWDNLTSKGSPVQLCERVAVWCPLMRDEAVKLYGFSPNDVVNVGPLPFDVHVELPAMDERDGFLRKVGLDPNKRLITYTSVTPAVCPFSAAYAEVLAGMIAVGRFREPCQLWVRLHPQDDFRSFDKLSRLPDVHVERAGTYRGSASGHRAIFCFDPTHAEMRRLTQTLAFSDVVVNIASTVTLDCCAIDRPVVNIAFNPPAAEDRFLDMGEYYSLSHYRPVTRSGAVPIVRSEDELCAAIQESLADPSKRSAARRALYQQFDPFRDGRAAVRLAEAIHRFLQREGCAEDVPSSLAAA